MRDILFRGKQADTGEWMYGNFASVDRDVFIISLTTEPDTENGGSVPSCITVIPATVGQYTGMTCMDGTQIFEGEILQIGPPGCGADICAVVWQESTLTWALTGMEKDGFTLGDFSPDDITVIGNIHDNPELLQEAGL